MCEKYKDPIDDFCMIAHQGNQALCNKNCDHAVNKTDGCRYEIIAILLFSDQVSKITSSASHVSKTH